MWVVYRLTTPLRLELLSDRNRAFEVFRKSYRKNELFEEQKASLKDKYDEAKVVHDAVNQARKNMGLSVSHLVSLSLFSQTINSSLDTLKNRIESLRAEKALQGLLDHSESVSDSRDPEEQQCLRQIGEEKKRSLLCFLFLYVYVTLMPHTIVTRKILKSYVP